MCEPTTEEMIRCWSFYANHLICDTKLTQTTRHNKVQHLESNKHAANNTMNEWINEWTNASTISHVPTVQMFFHRKKKHSLLLVSKIYFDDKVRCIRMWFLMSGQQFHRLSLKRIIHCHIEIFDNHHCHATHIDK